MGGPMNPMCSCHLSMHYRSAHLGALGSSGTCAKRTDLHS